MNSLRLVLVFFLCELFIELLLLVPLVSAASLTLASDKQSLQIGDEYSVNATLGINAPDGTTYYLRGEFFQPGSTNYCGFTWNGSGWYNGPYTGDGVKNLLPISITNNSWTGVLKTKIDPDDSGCKSSGSYSFKITRYTASGSSSSDTQNDLPVTLTVPTPTSTPAPTSKPPSTPIPTKAPTAALTHASPFTGTPTSKPLTISVLSDESIASHSSDSSKSAQPTAVLITSASPTARSKTPTPLILGSSKNSFPITPFLVLGGGIISCGILTLVIRRRRQGQEV